MKRLREKLGEEYGEDVFYDVDCVLQKFSQLRYQLMTDKPLDSFPDNYRDVLQWNDFIDQKRTKKDVSSTAVSCQFHLRFQMHDNHVEFLTWYHGEWLFVECYLYRLLFSAFQYTQYLHDYDYFADQKMGNFNDQYVLLLLSIRFFHISF